MPSTPSSPRSAWFVASWAVLVAAASLGACAQIIGADEPHLKDASGAGASAGEGGGGGSGGSMTPGEVCGNGSDDDGDGRIDCEDDDCCIPEGPPGMTGPFALYVGPQGSAPACETGWTLHDSG